MRGRESEKIETMPLGKRPRPPITRTTSMTGITVDFGDDVGAPAPSDPRQEDSILYGEVQGKGSIPTAGGGFDQRLLAAMVSPRNHRRNSLSGQFLETADFLRTCGLCNRRLAPARDIYMYRGDTAFCSVECREEQMKQDEIKERYSVAAVAASANNNGKKCSGAAAFAAATSKAA